MTQAVEPPHPPNTWVSRGRLSDAFVDSKGLLNIGWTTEEGKRHDAVVPSTARLSVGSRDETPEGIAAVDRRGADVGPPIVWVGQSAEGVWGVAVWPHDPHGAVKAWMN